MLVRVSWLYLAYGLTVLVSIELQERSYLHSRKTSVHSFFSSPMQNAAPNALCMCDINYDRCSSQQRTKRYKIRNKTTTTAFRVKTTTHILQSIWIAMAVIHSIDCVWYFIKTLIEINEIEFTFSDGIAWVLQIMEFMRFIYEESSHCLYWKISASIENWNFHLKSVRYFACVDAAVPPCIELCSTLSK